MLWTGLQPKWDWIADVAAPKMRGARRDVQTHPEPIPATDRKKGGGFDRFVCLHPSAQDRAIRWGLSSGRKMREERG